MLNKGPNVPPAVASGLICLVIGGAIGINFRDEHTKTTDKSPNVSLSAMSKGGGGGGGGGQQASASRELTGLVRNLATVQKVQNRGITAEQSAKLLPILSGIQSADKLPDEACKAKIDAIKAVLTPDQTQMLTDMSPRPAGGAGGAGGGMGKMGGAPGGGGGGGMMGGGAQPDPDKPFASDRNKKALTDLISALGSVK